MYFKTARDAYIGKSAEQYLMHHEKKNLNLNWTPNMVLVTPENCFIICFSVKQGLSSMSSPLQCNV